MKEQTFSNFLVKKNRIVQKINEWKKLIAQNEIKKLFEDLENSLSATKLNDVLILLQRDFNQFQKNKIDGIISQDQITIRGNQITKRLLSFLSENENDIKSTILANNELETIFTIAQAIENLQTVEAIEKSEELLILEHTLYSENVLYNINFAEFDDNSKNELITFFDKVIRRINRGTTNMITLYHNHETYYNSYKRLLSKLLLILDVPKLSYNDEEIKVLKNIQVSLETKIKTLKNLKNDEPNPIEDRERALSGVRIVKDALIQLGEKTLMEKAEEFENSILSLFDHAEKYPTLNLYKEDEMVKFQNEIKISLLEIKK